jgi:putative colanic acid biosynthesis acetyltransferase WcaF
MNPSTRLDQFNNAHFHRGASRAKELLWMLCSSLFFRHSLAIGNGLKISLLRLFGAQIGLGVLIKPAVTIKFPWKLRIGNHVWIGENVWIDNLDTVILGSHVCISQGALLLCGNHNYKSPAFDLITGPITLEDGAWVGAKAIVCPGVTVGSHAVLTAGSVAAHDLDAYTIYSGHPAEAVRERKMGV